MSTKLKVVCDHCRQEVEFTPVELTALGWKLNLDNARGVACPDCAEIEDQIVEITPEQLRAIKVLIRHQARQPETQDRWRFSSDEVMDWFDTLVKQDRARIRKVGL